MATVVVVFQILTVVPSIGRAAAIPDAARRVPHLRLVTANLRYTNPTPERLAAELFAADADVIVLQEVTAHWIDVLDAAGFSRRYPYSLREPRENPLGEAIYSRLPLDHALVVEPDVQPHARGGGDGRPPAGLRGERARDRPDAGHDAAPAVGRDRP